MEKSGESITIEKSEESNNVKVKAKVQCNCPQHTTWILINHEQNEQHNATTDISYIKDSFKCQKVKIHKNIVKHNEFIL